MPTPENKNNLGPCHFGYFSHLYPATVANLRDTHAKRTSGKSCTLSFLLTSNLSKVSSKSSLERSSLDKNLILVPIWTATSNPLLFGNFSTNHSTAFGHVTRFLSFEKKKVTQPQSTKVIQKRWVPECKTFLFTYTPSRFDSNPAAGNLNFSSIANVAGSWWWVAAILAFEKTGKTLKISSNSDWWLLRYSSLALHPSNFSAFQSLWSGTTKKITFLHFCHFSCQKRLLVTLCQLCEEVLAKSEPPGWWTSQ